MRTNPRIERSNIDSVDRLLQLAFLEGSVTTHGLYEKVVLRRPEAVRGGDSVRGATLRRLIEILPQPSAPKTIGEFLRDERKRRSVPLSLIQRRLGMPDLAYKMLENDSISPLKVPRNTWRRVKDLWKVPWREMEAMIRASHYLTVFRPSYKGTLLRYRRKTNSTYPMDARFSAARELYLRAKLPLPAREQLSIEKYLSELKRPENGLLS